MKFLFGLATLATLGLFSLPAQAAPPKVVTSIAPVHSLVSMVMQGVGEPYLLIRGSGSPHAYSLRPSDARALSDADLVFWVGETLEITLPTPLQTLAANAFVVTLSKNPALQTLRVGPLGEQPNAPDIGARDFGAIDMHIWLDPANAKLMVDEIAASLVKADPDNAQTYNGNAAIARQSISDLKIEIETMLAPVKEEKFIFLHDAYRYFERAFAITPVATLTASPQNLPGARKIAEISDLIRQQNVSCIFSEPQFSPRLVEAIAKATGVASGVLDPLGAALTPGPLLYSRLLRTMAGAMGDCFQE